MPKILKLKELSFLVYGLGLSGQSVIKFFKKNKIKNLKIWDDKKINLLKKYKAKNLKQTLNQVDFIILAPGISLLRNKNLRKFKKKIITDIDLFYLKNNDKYKTIVVTGTNGKSTTCKLLEHLLKKNNFKCSLGGNIGKPILNLKVSKNSYVIIEASSFQLSHSKFIRPTYAFFLNLTNDHLDWHGSMKNYLNSKLKIFNLQNKNHYALVNNRFKRDFKNKKFLSKFIPPEIFKFKKIKNKINNDYLNSGINDENMSFIFAFSKLIKIKENKLINSMKTFKGLPHRFEIFLKKKNITFINDSKATSFEATRSALSNLRNIYWILGGLPKKNDVIDLSKFKKNIIKCYLIGKDTNFFQKHVKEKIVFSVTKNLKNSVIQILKDIKLHKKIKKNILLSPSAGYVKNMLENSFKFIFINYWRNIDKKILFCFFILFFLGLFFSFASTSSLAGERLNKDYYFFFTKHLVFTFFALLVMITISIVKTKVLIQLIFPLFTMSFILLALVPIIGIEVKGAKRWLDLYFFKLQPIEILKPLFILTTVKILTLNKFQNSQIKYLLSFILLSLIIILLIDQPDLGQSILLIGSWVATVFIAGVSLIYIFIFFSLFFISLSSLLFFLPEKFGYIINRLITFFDPSQGDKFQSSSALDAIKLGGLTGQGMGEGILKESVPEAHTDYVIAVISEEFGSLASIIILIIFLYISFRIIKNCFNQENQFLKISLVGLAALLIFQTFIHAGVNTNLLPTTGMTLPFLSYGGSSLFGSAILAGLVLNCTKNKAYLYE